jgi:hypothetical protein
MLHFQIKTLPNSEKVYRRTRPKRNLAGCGKIFQ